MHRYRDAFRCNIMLNQQAANQILHTLLCNGAALLRNTGRKFFRNRCSLHRICGTKRNLLQSFTCREQRTARLDPIWLLIGRTNTLFASAARRRHTEILFKRTRKMRNIVVTCRKRDFINGKARIQQQLACTFHPNPQQIVCG